MLLQLPADQRSHKYKCRAVLQAMFLTAGPVTFVGGFPTASASALADSINAASALTTTCAQFLANLVKHLADRSADSTK